MDYFMDIYQESVTNMDQDSLTCIEFDSLLETLDLPACDSPATAFGNLESVLPVTTAPSQEPDATSMPHEWTQLQNLLSEHAQAAEQLYDETCEKELEDSSHAAATESLPYDEEGRLMGWTPEDNKRFANHIVEMLTTNSAECGERVKWQEITDRFNKKYGQGRSKIQMYSHYRYLFFGKNRMPCYLRAEEEVIMALDEMGVAPRWMPPFLKTERSEEILVIKLKRLKASAKAKAAKGSCEGNFRRKIKEIMHRTGGLSAIENNSTPKKAIQLVRHLVETNSHVKKKYNALQRTGRPPKKTKMVPVTLKLKTMFRPFIYVTTRRKRKTCLPGDARKCGLNLFCLNRLLGYPLELNKMPCDPDEAIKVGVNESDYPQYEVLRHLMLTHAQQMEPSESNSLPVELQSITNLKPQAHLEDREYYESCENPPVECILPPTLYTLTGLRGLLCYRDTLKAIIEDDDTFNKEAAQESAFGDPKADKRLEKLMLSMFQSAWNLSEAQGESADNSDGDTDSDEEVCFTKQPTVEEPTFNQEENMFDQILMEGTRTNAPTIDQAGVAQMDWVMTEQLTEDILEALSLPELHQNNNYPGEEPSFMFADLRAF